MQLAERILRHTRCLKQELIERCVVALRLSLDRLPAETIDCRSEARLDLGARDVELLGDNVHVERHGPLGRGRFLGCGGAGGGLWDSKAQYREGALRPRAYRVLHKSPRVEGAPQRCCGARSGG